MRKRLRIGLLTLLASLLVLTGGLWLWSDSSNSLATALRLIPRLLPSGQTLEVGDVTGSMRAGGHIGWLRWQQGELRIEALDIRASWSLAPLLHQELRLDQLHIRQLRVDDRRVHAADRTATPPASLSLPVQVAAPVRVDALAWGENPLQTLTGLAFHYRFDGTVHQLAQGRVQIAAGTYAFSGRLQAQVPMALALDANGVIPTTVPSSQRPLKVQARAALTGALAGSDAQLSLQATLTPEPPANQPHAAKPAAMQASLSAQIAPWQGQAIVSAQGHWQALDLAALWPQAPRTLLSGDADVSPAGRDWQARVNLVNALPGPWNQQRLPLTALSAELAFRHNQWQLQTLQATGAGGLVQGNGQLTGTLWQGQARVTGIDPSALDTRLASARIGGQLHARQTTQGIAFDANLQADPPGRAPPAATPGPNALHALHLQSLDTEGLWTAPLLTLNRLRIDAQDARLQGRLSYQTQNQAGSAQLALSLPGLQATLDGHLARSDGQGTLALQLQDAALTSGYLARWPSLAAALQNRRWHGSATLQAQWQGGWQHQAEALRLSASLRVPRLAAINPAPGDANALSDWRWHDLQVDLNGTPEAFSLTGQGQTARGVHTLHWQTLAHGGRQRAGGWQASVDQFKLAWQDLPQTNPWTLQWGTGTGAATDPAMTLAWQPSPPQNTLTLSAGQATLQGPAPGVATLSWQPARWTQAVASGKTPAPVQWQSQGQLTGVPLAWLERLGDKSLAELGLSSDLLLSGRWELAQTDTLHAQLTLERSAGDLRLRADEGRGLVLPAGMRDAWLQLNLDRDQLSGSLRWDSARAGKALMAFSTRVQTTGGAWLWADDAPVAGSLQLQLPPVDAWSALAPPGWRLRGTMTANLSLDGTRRAPGWAGTVQARDLALKSVVDGLDFSQGTLSARVHGQQLDIDNFSVQGAGASSSGAVTQGGQLTVSGSVGWLTDRKSSSLASHLRMALSVEARALRLSSRPDRRATVSGQLSADLRDARLSLRGALSADQALLTLPDDTAPQLGADVVVRPTSGPTALGAPSAAGVQARTAPLPGAGPRLTSDVLIDLDLGRDFQVRGRGLDARLAGKLSLRAVDAAPPRLEGTVHTAGGSYRAYGQRLDIEQGVLRFDGPPDNPTLSILAIRPKLSQRVGVQISGTAQSPLVRLYSDPDLPDAEKLAWLVLGRSGSSGGAETALMQQAALALLGGNGQSLSASLAQALGLDELSFSGNTNANAGDNVATTGGASVTLGKRLSSDFYVAYESSLNGAMGLFYIFYDLSKRLTLRTQTGEQSAVDLIFTLRYD